MELPRLGKATREVDDLSEELANAQKCIQILKDESKRFRERG